ncbi:hypothetical protein HHI36_013384 [Cryptolaemus montrouzieri]|uniref:Uncharacterized protein n=1 Tax=Cryptolaemus montrouzieri TaxID=559131 RepID=A0ABD2NH09_9CUCU
MGFHVKMLSCALNDDQMEQLWIRVSMKKCIYAFGVVYRLPDASIDRRVLEESLISINLDFDRTVLVDDLDINYIQEPSIERKLCYILEAYTVTRIVKEPTRITDNSITLIDLFCCDNNLTYANSKVVDLWNLADHTLASCKMNVEVPTESPRIFKFRHFGAFNHEDFLRDALAIDLDSIYFFADVNEKNGPMNSAILSLFDAPYRTVSVEKLALLTSHIIYRNKQIRNYLVQAIRK